MRSIYCLSFLFLLLHSHVSEAEARSTKKGRTRVAIGAFEGPGGPELEAVVTSVLARSKGLELVSAEEWRAAGGRLGVDSASSEGLVRVAAELGVGAIVTGTFQPAGKSWQASAVVLAGQSGASVGTYATKQKTKAKALSEVKKRFLKKLGKVIRAQKAPQAPPPVEEPVSSGPEETPAPPEPSPAPVGPKKRVVILGFEGDRLGELGDFLEKEFTSSRDIEPVPKDELERVVKELSLNLDDEEDRAKAASRLEIAAFIGGEIDKADREIRVAFVVYGGFDGELVGKGESSSTRISSLARVLRRDLAPHLEAARAPGSAPVAPAPPSVRAPEPEATRTESRAPTSAPLGPGMRSESPLEFALGFQWGLRDFGYRDDLFGALRAYQHPGLTSLAARLLWYPGAHFTRGFAAHLGVDAELNLGLGLSTETADGVSEFATSALSLTASLRARLPLGRHELGFFAGIAIDQFALDDAETLFPNAAYTALRPGLAGRFWLGERISLSPHFAWRVVMAAGDVTGADWFPRASVGGLDAGLSVGVAVVGPLELQIAGTYRRYFYSMNPEVGDARVAGGALDQRVSATLYLAFHLD